MSTPNLAIAHIHASQDQKEVTANAAFDALDLALTESGLLDVSAGGIVSVPPAQALGLVRLVLTGAPGAAVTVAFPAVKRLVLVRNEADAVKDQIAAVQVAPTFSEALDQEGTAQVMI